MDSVQAPGFARLGTAPRRPRRFEMTKDELSDTLAYVEERADYDPALPREVSQRFEALFAALSQAVEGDFAASTTRERVTAALAAASAVAAPETLAAKNGWAAVISGAARRYLGQE